MGMTDFLTTHELATLLRVKERKIYDLVAKGEIPFKKVTGKLLFARSEIEGWIGGGKAETPREHVGASTRAFPAVAVGGHDPLLEWALRQSGSGIATFLDGALDGLRRATAGDCIVAGLHIPEGEGEWNVGAVAERFAGEPWVLIEWARRRRGLVVRRGLGRVPRRLAETRGLRFQSRQPEAGSQLILKRLLAREGLGQSDLTPTEGCERTESDLAQAIATGRADVGLGIEAAARQYGLDFVPLVEERFDLLVWRRAYFEPPFQRFIRFCGTDALREKADSLGGYDVSGLGTVHFNGE